MRIFEAGGKSNEAGAITEVQRSKDKGQINKEMTKWKGRVGAGFRTFSLLCPLYSVLYTSAQGAADS
jgi:hypothetical protein